MSAWGRFWDELNIRKLALLVILGLYGASIIITGRDMGVKDMLLMIVSYYFGYNNGTKHPEEADKS